MKKNNISGDAKLMELMMKEFFVGRTNNVSLEDEKVINKIFASNHDNIRQLCRDLFIHIKFQGKELSWSDLDPTDEWKLGPHQLTTDQGESCCFLGPYMTMEPIDWTKTNIIEIYHNGKAEAKQGQANGLTIMIDAERFNLSLIHI